MAKKVKGRKRHIVTDTEGSLLEILVQTANIQDNHGAVPLLRLIGQKLPKLRYIFADRVYRGPKLLDALADLGKWTIEIVTRSQSVSSTATASVACNAAHSIEQRTAKWIAAAAARTDTPSVPFTHEQLSAILGVGRSYASRVIETLAAQNILDTKRGSLTIRDMAALRAKACACNDEAEKHCQELLGLPK